MTRQCLTCPTLIRARVSRRALFCDACKLARKRAAARVWAQRRTAPPPDDLPAPVIDTLYTAAVTRTTWHRWSRVLREERAA